MATIPASPLLVAGFDATNWITEWSEHGGIVILAGEHLYLRREPHLPLPSSSRLDRLRADLIRLGGGQAVADQLARRREGIVV